MLTTNAVPVATPTPAVRGGNAVGSDEPVDATIPPGALRGTHTRAPIKTEAEIPMLEWSTTAKQQRLATRPLIRLGGSPPRGHFGARDVVPRRPVVDEDLPGAERGLQDAATGVCNGGGAHPQVAGAPTDEITNCSLIARSSPPSSEAVLGIT